MDTEARQHLHSLEEVGSRYSNAAVRYARGVCWVVVIASWIAPGVWVSAGPVALLLAFILISEWDYKTDQGGLVISGVRQSIFYTPRVRRIGWEDVVEVRSVDMRRGKIVFTMRGGARVSVVLGPDHAVGFDAGSGVSTYAIEASIWQHLSQLGKADGMELRPEAESFWDDVPSGVPEAMIAEVPAGELTATYSVNSDELSEAWRSTEGGDVLSGNGGHETVCFWEATGSEWTSWRGGELELAVRAGGREIRLRADGNGSQMKGLVLATVRQLRKHPATDAVWLPNELV